MAPMRGAGRDYQLTGLLDDGASELVHNFDEFWERYPRKVGKGQSRKAYIKALKVAKHDDIMFGLSQQIASMEAKEKQFIPHASTWLNGERWTDEPEELTSGNRKAGNAGGSPGNNEARNRSIRAAERFGERGFSRF